MVGAFPPSLLPTVSLAPAMPEFQKSFRSIIMIFVYLPLVKRQLLGVGDGLIHGIQFVVVVGLPTNGTCVPHCQG